MSLIVTVPFANEMLPPTKSALDFFPAPGSVRDKAGRSGAITTAMVSVLTGIPVRADVAMTGEITLRGEILPIGGLKEKLLAAHRGGIRHVLIPHDNVRDLEEIPDNVKQDIEIHPVRWIDEVLDLALQEPPAGFAVVTSA